jgi:hypothetical protein
MFQIQFKNKDNVIELFRVEAWSARHALSQFLSQHQGCEVLRVLGPF